MTAQGPNSIVLVGSDEDLHVQAVASRIRDLGDDCLIASRGTEFALDFSSPSSSETPRRLLLSHTGCPFSPSVVWWRLKAGFFRKHDSDPITQFARREWTHALEGLEGVLEGAHWVNARDVDKRMGNKPNQLAFAHRMGLRVPRGLITNDAARAIEFISEMPNKRGIYKIFTWYDDGSDGQTFTNVVDVEFLRAHSANIRMCPGIFQEVVPKRYELRVTIVGNRVFTVRIGSQERPDTEVDWRRNQMEVPYSAGSLPPAFEASLLRFHKASGLVYGAYDLIVRPDGDYVFLEVNPGGQWLWIEKATGVGITDAMARMLLDLREYN